VSDFKRILDGLNGAGVRYVLIGGIALIRHGVVRATRDVAAVITGASSEIGAATAMTSPVAPALAASGRLPNVALPSTPTGRVLFGARTALGISTLFAPRIAGKLFFLDPDANPQSPVLGRFFGVRNLSLAAGMYATTGPNRAQWWRLQPVVDTLDFLAIAAEWRRGALSWPAAVLMGGTAVGATALGILSVSGESAATDS
jgi:hypothetical protein